MTNVGRNHPVSKTAREMPRPAGKRSRKHVVDRPTDQTALQAELDERLEDRFPATDPVSVPSTAIPGPPLRSPGRPCDPQVALAIPRVAGKEAVECMR